MLLFDDSFFGSVRILCKASLSRFQISQIGKRPILDKSIDFKSQKWCIVKLSLSIWWVDFSELNPTTQYSGNFASIPSKLPADKENTLYSRGSFFDFGVCVRLGEERWAFIIFSRPVEPLPLTSRNGRITLPGDFVQFVYKYNSFFCCFHIM